MTMRRLTATVLLALAILVALLAMPLVWVAAHLKAAADRRRGRTGLPVAGGWVARPRLVLPQCAIEAILRQHEAAVMVGREKVH